MRHHKQFGLSTIDNKNKMKVFVCLLATLALVNAGGFRGGAGGGGGGGYLPGGGRGGRGPVNGAGLISHVSQNQGNTKVHIGGAAALGGGGGGAAAGAAYGAGLGGGFKSGGGGAYGAGGAGGYGAGGAGGYGGAGAGGWQGQGRGGRGGAGAGGNAWGNPAQFDYTVNHASSANGGSYGAVAETMTEAEVEIEVTADGINGF
ncbi:uncharacterized protein Dwil_GK25130 [Drosophila willistoni]|uniref:DUF4766 domain-containing protein n=1 Tax=Drosophila willistoni TaxID=7260 RepID=B4NC79_DROWI|nr:uncharacterized protein Dwil_GK25130 [Drosophila willistoni]